MIDESKITPRWLAGFFDGEGCVSLKRHGRSWQLRVNITQANYPLLALLAVKFNAAYGPYTKTRRTKNGNESTVYEIGWHGMKAKAILELLQGHCIVKSQQIAIGLEFIKTVIPNGDRFTRGHRYTPEIHEEREKMRLKLRGLNHAGPYKPAAESNEGVDTVH